MNQKTSVSHVQLGVEFTKFEGLEQSYVRPTAFLPHESKIVSRQTLGIEQNSSLASIHAAVHEVCRQAAKTTTTLKSCLLSQTELAYELKRLESSVANASRLLTDEFGLPSTRFTQRSRKLAAGATAKTVAGDRLDDYRIYDNYFNVLRIPSMSSQQLACQIAATCLEVSGDLSFTVLDLDQVLTLTETIQAMFRFIAVELGLNEKLSAPRKRSIVLLQPSAQSLCWLQAPKPRSEERKSWSRRIALYRWCVGHHLFNLCAIVCAHHLDLAGKAFESADESKGAALISKAAGFRRGGTGAMRYAANFPAEIYLDHIRPSMSKAGAPNGFSGSQNSDYNHLKASKKTLGDKLRQCFGGDAKGWPASIRGAARNFQEAEIEDNEHHIIIAVAKVGADSSLAQKKWQSRLPSDAQVKNAVSILRDMAEMKRRGDGL